MKAVDAEESRRYKLLATITRIATSDDNKRNEELWKELSRGDR